MAYVLVREVGDALDGALFDSPLGLVVLVRAYLSNLKASLLVFGDDGGVVHFHLLHLKCAFDDVQIVLQIVF